MHGYATHMFVANRRFDFVVESRVRYVRSVLVVNMVSACIQPTVESQTCGSSVDVGAWADEADPRTSLSLLWLPVSVCLFAEWYNAQQEMCNVTRYGINNIRTLAQSHTLVCPRIKLAHSHTHTAVWLEQWPVSHYCTTHVQPLY